MFRFGYHDTLFQFNVSQIAFSRRWLLALELLLLRFWTDNYNIVNFSQLVRDEITMRKS